MGRLHHDMEMRGGSRKECPCHKHHVNVFEEEARYKMMHKKPWGHVQSNNEPSKAFPVEKYRLRWDARRLSRMHGIDGNHC